MGRSELYLHTSSSRERYWTVPTKWRLRQDLLDWKSWKQASWSLSLTSSRSGTQRLDCNSSALLNGAPWRVPWTSTYVRSTSSLVFRSSLRLLSLGAAVFERSPVRVEFFVVQDASTDARARVPRVEWVNIRFEAWIKRPVNIDGDVLRKLDECLSRLPALRGVTLETKDVTAADELMLSLFKNVGRARVRLQSSVQAHTFAQHARTQGSSPEIQPPSPFWCRRSDDHMWHRWYAQGCRTASAIAHRYVTCRLPREYMDSLPPEQRTGWM